MASIITVAQRKGGAGKTTLAAQLAVAAQSAGKRVACIDLDGQGSLTAWALRRKKLRTVEPIVCEKTTGFGLFAAIRRLGSADIVLIDTAPTIDLTVRRAIRAADIVLIPLQLSPLDLEATLPTATVIGEEGGRALFVINRAPPRARIAEVIRSRMKEAGVLAATSELGARAAFIESMAKGAGAIELAPSSPAASEAAALMAEVLFSLGLAKPRRAAVPVSVVTSCE